MNGSVSDTFAGRFPEMWERHRKFLRKAAHSSEFTGSIEASLDRDANEIIASVDSLRPQIDDLDIDEDHRLVWHGNLSIFQSAIARYLSKRGRHSEACELAREAVRHCEYNAHILEALVTVLLDAGLIREAAIAVNNAPDGTIATEEDSTARYILTVAFKYLQFGRELSASRVKQCVELVAEHTRMRKPGTCLLCGK
jgi:hypothetical protein